MSYLFVISKVTGQARVICTGWEIWRSDMICIKKVSLCPSTRAICTCQVSLKQNWWSETTGMMKDAIKAAISSRRGILHCWNKNYKRGKKRCQFRFLPELLRKPMMVICSFIKGIYSENDRGSEWALDGWHASDTSWTRGKKITGNDEILDIKAVRHLAMVPRTAIL